MKVRKIVHSFKEFLNENNKYSKTPLEKEIEAKAMELKMPYNKRLADIKASAHAVHFLRGGELSNQAEYLNRMEFGKTASQRIIEIYENSNLFADHFQVFLVDRPPVDKRFGDTKKFKGVKMIDSWTRENLGITDAVMGKGQDQDEAFRDLFARFEKFAQMIENSDYNFRRELGKTSQWATNDKKHSGGAFTTGLIVLPTEATPQEKEEIGEKYSFHMKHRNDAAYIMALEAEKNLQQALEMALKLWRKFPFKDGNEQQMFAGAVIRMQKALEQSKEDMKRIKDNPGEYQGSSLVAKQETNDEEKAEELLIKARTKNDKAAAAEAWALFKKLKNKHKAREARMLMR